ncbi:MAG: glycosyltransferase [Flavobacterium sp.]|nr:glycosyltransferase [Flavobacterium sp.]
MLSILIPIYNYNVYPLVFELHRQCTECGIAFEILAQDDASQSPLNKENEKVNTLPHCSFVSLKQNMAHRENRNSLAEQAKFDYLLFIDGDSIIVHPDYIQNYLRNLDGFDVVYGGRQHPEKCPSEKQSLRWKYGKFIEDKLAINRRKTPYKSLLFNNTVITKKCFNQVKFDKDITLYGHDDTQFAYQLSLLQAKVNHIDNSVEHGDIDTNQAYLAKTESSLKSLLLLYQSGKIASEFVSILKLYVLLKKTKLIVLATVFHKLFQKSIAKSLLSENPTLFLFNVYRIGYLCTLKS